MDNDNLSKIPVSELTPENLNSLKGGQTFKESPHKSNPQKPQGTSRLPLLIAGVVLLIGVGIALFFIFRKPAQDPESPTSQEPTDELEVTWEPSEGSTNPSQEFHDHHQAIVDNPTATPEEKYTSTLEIANLYISTRRYDEAESVLNSISREDLTAEQQFRLYGVYRSLYVESGNTVAAEEYAKLVDEALNAYMQSQAHISEE